MGDSYVSREAMFKETKGFSRETLVFNHLGVMPLAFYDKNKDNN